MWLYWLGQWNLIHSYHPAVMNMAIGRKFTFLYCLLLAVLLRSSRWRILMIFQLSQTWKFVQWIQGTWMADQRTSGGIHDFWIWKSQGNHARFLDFHRFLWISWISCSSCIHGVNINGFWVSYGFLWISRSRVSTYVCLVTTDPLSEAIVSIL